MGWNLGSGLVMFLELVLLSRFSLLFEVGESVAYLTVGRADAAVAFL